MEVQSFEVVRNLARDDGELTYFRLDPRRRRPLGQRVREIGSRTGELPGVHAREGLRCRAPGDVVRKELTLRCERSDLLGVALERVLVDGAAVAPRQEERKQDEWRCAAQRSLLSGTTTVCSTVWNVKLRRPRAFVASGCFVTPLHWCVFRAPVAQGIERCPAEAEVACSNHAGRTPLGNPPRFARHDDFRALA